MGDVFAKLPPRFAALSEKGDAKELGFAAFAAGKVRAKELGFGC